MRKLFKKLSGLDRTAAVQEEEILEYEDAEEGSEYETDESPTETSDDEGQDEEEKQWLQEDYEEGQLSIDVYQTPSKLIVKSTIAGVKPEDIDISINNDMLTIRGKREMQEKIRDDNYLYRECYWGSFSRSVILPIEIEADKIEAFLENGVLTVVLPKAKNAQQISIKVREK